MSEMLPASKERIDEFLAAFESGTLPKARWTHAAHLLVGACYVHQRGEAAAIGQMRECVKRYNVAVGTQNTESAGYHETLTMFWIKVIAAFLVRHPGMPRAEFAGLVVREFAGQRDLFKSYYEFDVVGSREARAQWVEPTLRKIASL